jgi:hypothetical protein
VLERAGSNKHQKAQWLCACICGNKKIIGGNQLQRGLARSCGCLRRETVKRMWTTHGATRERDPLFPTYLSYKAAQQRCRNPNHSHYRHYGGRGVQFRFASFEEFLAEVGKRPEGSTIERIDNDGHYEKGNVRWATNQQQGNNKRTNRRVTAFGRTRTISWWSRETRIRPSIISDRLRACWPAEKALTKPPRVIRPPLSPPRKSGYGKPLTAFGRTLTGAAWSRETGIPASLIYGMLARGWTIEETLSAKQRWSRRADALTNKRAAS